MHSHRSVSATAAVPEQSVGFFNFVDFGGRVNFAVEERAVLRTLPWMSGLDGRLWQTAQQSRMSSSCAQ